MNALLLLALSVGAPAEIGKDNKADKAEKAELEKFQGAWKLTERETRGTAMPAQKGATADRYTLVVVGDAYVLTTHAGTLKFDPAKKTVDMTVTEGRYKGMTVPGIYELTGDTLKIALQPPSVAGAGNRPTELKSTAESRTTVYTFEKDGKATRDDAAAKLKELKTIVTATAAPAARFARPDADQATQEMLRKVMDKLDAIDKRLDAIEKRLPPAEKK